MRLLKRLAVVVTVAAAILATGAVAANADVPCPSGVFCTYRDVFGGPMYYYSPVGGCIEVGYPWDDAVSSYRNNSSYQVRIYASHGCSGGSSVINPGQPRVEGYILNDTLSSFYFAGA